jgi:hypothetical protein
LIPSTKYYVRAYATNSQGTRYGNQVIFNTQDFLYQLNQFNFYKDQSIDTILYKKYLSSSPPETPWKISITNNLVLPKGIFLFIRVDSIQGNVIAYRNNDTTSRVLNSGDTMQIINDDNSYTIQTPLAYNSFGNYWYESTCQLAIKAGVKAIPPDNTYYCKWYMIDYNTMTNDVPNFYSDSSYHCNFIH